MEKFVPFTKLDHPLGKKLKQFRFDLRVRIRDFIEQSGIGAVRYSKLERGVSIPTQEETGKIIKACRKYGADENMLKELRALATMPEDQIPKHEVTEAEFAKQLPSPISLRGPLSAKQINDLIEMTKESLLP